MLTGSYNWTRGAANFNAENIVVPTSRDCSRLLASQFEICGRVAAAVDPWRAPRNARHAPRAPGFVQAMRQSFGAPRLARRVLSLGYLRGLEQVHMKSASLVRATGPARSGTLWHKAGTR